MSIRRNSPVSILLLCICLMSVQAGVPSRAQENAAATLADAEAELKQIAKAPDVQQDLEEPDGVAMQGLDTDNWKIIAVGTGTYEFNDAEERKDATEEAQLEAKAALAKFIKEELVASSKVDTLAERESKKSKANGQSNTTASVNRVKTTLTSIHNSANEILSGVLTLEQTFKWDGNSGEVRVKIGQSKKSLEAAADFRNRTANAIKQGDNATKSGTVTRSGSDGKLTPEPSTIKRKNKTDF